MKEENVTADTASPDPAAQDSVVANDTAAYAEPALGKPDAQPEETVQANSTVEEPAPEQANSTVEEPSPQPEAATAETETISSDEALPVLDDSTEAATPTAEEDAQANSTIELAPQPEAAAVEAEADPRGWLPSVDMDGQLARSAVEGANLTEGADAAEEANRTEEPAPQLETAVDPQEALRRENERLRAEVEALRKPDAAAAQADSTAGAPAPQPQAQASEDLLPWVDGGGLEASALAEEASARAEEARNATAEPAEEARSAAAPEEEQNATTG